MRRVNKTRLLKILIVIFIVTLIVIGIKNWIPQSKAELPTLSTIEVTYKSGDGNGDDITITQTATAQKTQGTYDYTDNKVVLLKNGEDGINFTHDKKDIIINDTKYSYDVLVSGWKLTAVTKEGKEYTTFIDPENYNYTDLENSQKDINTIYAQHGWYIVPNGVTSITLEAVWGWAIYVKDPYNTMVYDQNYWFDTAKSIASGRTGASEANFGTNTKDDVVASIKRAYEIIDLAGESGNNFDVYSHLIVLCGDIHDVRPSVATIPSTVYADIINGETIYDINQYNTNLTTARNANNSYWGNVNRKVINATFTSDPAQNTTYKLYQKCQTWGWTCYGGLRFDNVIYSIIKKVEGSNITLSSTIIYMGGTNKNLKFITTENFHNYSPNGTGSYENTIFTIEHKGLCNEVKVLGGRFTVCTASHPMTTDVDLNHLKYILLGGNAYISGYHSGTSSELNPAYKRKIYDVPTLCITGGYINGGIYLTGNSSTNSITLNRQDKTIYLYMTNGYDTSTIYGSGGEALNEGDVNINITNSIIRYIYGGGSKETGNINGNVYLNLKDTQVGISTSTTGAVYGGPQYGNITKDTHLNLDNVKVYGYVYGAGYGSNSSNTKYIENTSTMKNTTKDKSEIIKLINEGKEVEPDYTSDSYKIIRKDGKLVYYPWPARVDEFLSDSSKYLGFYEGDTTQIVTGNTIRMNNSLVNVSLQDNLSVQSLSAATVRNAYTNIKNSNITLDVYGRRKQGIST